MVVVITYTPNEELKGNNRGDRTLVLEALQELEYYDDIIMEYYGDYQYVLDPWKLRQSDWELFVSEFIRKGICNVIIL